MAKIRVFGDYMSLEMFSECVFGLFSFFFRATFFFLFWIGAPWPQISPRSWNDDTASLSLFFFYILIVFKFISEILIRFHSSFSFLPFQSFQASVRVDMFHFSWSDDVRGEVSRVIVFQFPLTNLNYVYFLSMDTSPCL